MQELTNNRRPLPRCPTRSLREYLTYSSAERTQGTEPTDTHNRIEVEVEVEVGDGRSQVIVVDAQTDIQQAAQQFCRKYHLEEYVSQLLADTLRQKYQQEVEETLSQQTAH